MNLANTVPVLLKLLGLFFLVEAASGGARAMVYAAMVFSDKVTYSGISTYTYPASSFAAAAVSLMLGLYLFYGARSLAAIIVPEAEQPGGA